MKKNRKIIKETHNFLNKFYSVVNNKQYVKKILKNILLGKPSFMTSSS